MSLSNSAPNGVLQLAMVKDNLFNEETRRKDMGKDNTQALVTENKGRSKTRNSKGRVKSRSQSESKGKFKCFYCVKGHIKETARLGKINKKIRKFRLRQKNKIPLLSHPKPKRVQSM